MGKVGTLLLLIAGALACPARPASAGDEGSPEVARLQAELARQRAATAHLREAYDTLNEASQRSARAVASLTSSMTVARGMLQTLTRERDELRDEVRRLRADIGQLAPEDPARLKLALRDEQAARAQDGARFQAKIAELQELSSLRAIRATQAEHALATAKEQHAAALEALRADLARAQETIKALRAGR